MSHPHLPYTLIIGHDVARIPVRDLADASCAYQDYRMRHAALSCPAGAVTIGDRTYSVGPDGTVWSGNFMLLEAQ